MTQSEFEAIARQLHDTAYDRAKRVVSAAEDAEDAAGDAMLRLWTLHESLKDDRHAFKLAAVIANNIAIDIVRRRKKRLSIFTDEDKGMEQHAGQWACPSEHIELEEEEEWLVEQMEKLPPRELQVLKMRQMEHRTTEEIARLLGIGESSVRVMLANARRKLFNDIKNRCKE